MSETSSAAGTPPVRRETPSAFSTNPGRAAPEKIAIPSLRGGSSKPVAYDPAQDRMGKNPVFERTDEDDDTVGLQGIQATAGHLAALREKKQAAIAASPVAQRSYVPTPATKTTKFDTEEQQAKAARGATPETNTAIPDATAHPAAPESARPPTNPIQRAIDARRALGADAKPPTGIPKPTIAPSAPPSRASTPPATHRAAPTPPDKPSDTQATSAAEPHEDHEEVPPKDVSSAHEDAVPSQAS